MTQRSAPRALYGPLNDNPSFSLGVVQSWLDGQPVASRLPADFALINISGIFDALHSSENTATTAAITWPSFQLQPLIFEELVS